MPCTGLAARLVQLRPGLGKARAKQLAAAACRYPDKQVGAGLSSAHEPTRMMTSELNDWRRSIRKK